MYRGRSMSRRVSKVDDGGHGHEKASQGVCLALRGCRGRMLPRCPRSATHVLRLLNHQSFKKESRAKARFSTIGTSTTLESNKSHQENNIRIFHFIASIITQYSTVSPLRLNFTRSENNAVSTRKTSSPDLKSVHFPSNKPSVKFFVNASISF